MTGPADSAASERRLAEAREFINGERGRDVSTLPAPVLGRSRAELLRHAAWLLGVIEDDPGLLDAALQPRAAAARTALETQLLALLPGEISDGDRDLAASLAARPDDVAPGVLRWLQRARIAQRLGPAVAQALADAVRWRQERAAAATSNRKRQPEIEQAGLHLMLAATLGLTGTLDTIIDVAAVKRSLGLKVAE